VVFGNLRRIGEKKRPLDPEERNIGNHLRQFVLTDRV
jgi:hypothetical protein